jgi:hypothetical protein
MRWPRPHLNKLMFELRYAQGHRYLDRCGETIIEIEDHAPGWISREVTPSGGGLIHMEKDIAFTFSSYKLDAGQDDPKDTRGFCEQVGLLTDIVCKILGISTYIRIGVRFIFLYPAASMEEAEELVRRSKVVVPDPKLVEMFGEGLRAQKHIFIFEKGQAGRRVEIGGLRREEGKLPPELLSTEPKNLPKGQREALARKLMETKRYSEAPRFSLQVDVDNYEYDPESFDVRSFIESHEDFVRNNLLRLMESRS